jgi:hypothetical protein
MKHFPLFVPMRRGLAGFSVCVLLVFSINWCLLNVFWLMMACFGVSLISRCYFFGQWLVDISILWAPCWQTNGVYLSHPSCIYSLSQNSKKHTQVSLNHTQTTQNTNNTRLTKNRIKHSKNGTNTLKFCKNREVCKPAQTVQELGRGLLARQGASLEIPTREPISLWPLGAAGVQIPLPAPF